MVSQVSFTLAPRQRGYHVITREVLSQLPELPAVG